MASFEHQQKSSQGQRVKLKAGDILSLSPTARPPGTFPDVFFDEKKPLVMTNSD